MQASKQTSKELKKTKAQLTKPQRVPQPHPKKTKAQRPSRVQFIVATMWTLRLCDVPKGAYHKAVSINANIYLFDSDTFDRDRSIRKPIEVHVFNSATYQWKKVKTQSDPDESPLTDVFRTVVSYGECAYLWGGLEDHYASNVIYCFDTKTMKWSRPIVSGERPPGRCGHTACVVGHRMYIFGGEPEHASFPPDIDVLDLVTMKWHRVSTTGESPRSRIFHSASAIGNCMYVWGGKIMSPWQGENSLYFLDTVTSSWVRPRVDGIPPEARYGHSAFVYNRELYIFGGMNESPLRSFSDIHKYNPEMSCWSKVTPNRSGPSVRKYAGCCVIGQRVFVFSGVDPHYQPLTDMHVLEFTPTLRTMCLLAVKDAGVAVSRLPPALSEEICTRITDDGTSTSYNGMADAVLEAYGTPPARLWGMMIARLMSACSRIKE